SKEPVLQLPRFSRDYKDSAREYFLNSRIKQIDEFLAESISQSLSGNNYFKQIVFLQHLEYIDEKRNIMLKGHIACEFNSVDCVIGTEVLFSPEASSVPASHLIIALVSLAFHEKYQLEETC